MLKSPLSVLSLKEEDIEKLLKSRQKHTQKVQKTSQSPKEPKKSDKERILG